MSWYVIEISESCILGGTYHRLCRTFQHAFIAAGAPPEMALLARRAAFDEARRIYISPASVPYLGNLLEEFGGQPCDCPGREEVTLVYGVPGAKAQLLNTVPEPVYDGWPEPALAQQARGDGASVYPVLPAR